MALNTQQLENTSQVWDHFLWKTFSEGLMLSTWLQGGICCFSDNAVWSTDAILTAVNQDLQHKCYYDWEDKTLHNTAAGLEHHLTFRRSA